MSSAKTGVISGFVVWIITCGVISMCMFPAAMFIGGFTSVTDFAMQAVGPLVCPEDTTVESRSYATTTTDDFGNRQPSTAYVLQCVDSSGTVVKEDPVLYAFIWIGGLSITGLVISAVLAFALAAPAGVLIGRLFKRGPKTDYTKNIEPR
jgi:hypothetical protein